MDKITLLDRIAKKEQTIEKINKRIDKWSKNLSNEQITFVQDNLEIPWAEYRNLKSERFNQYDDSMDELRRAYRDLNEAKITLDKYKNQLIFIEEKEGIEKIPILMEFFNRYKQQTIKYIEHNMETLLEYYKINRERINFHDEHRREIRNGEPDSEIVTQYKRLQLQESELRDAVHPITRDVYNRSQSDPIDYDRLNEILDKDIEAKYWNMIDKVTKITGEVIDMSLVSIGGDGNLNGIVIGKEGRAKLETILAGGHNIQCLHYRLLIHPIK